MFKFCAIVGITVCVGAYAKKRWNLDPGQCLLRASAYVLRCSTQCKELNSQLFESLSPKVPDDPYKEMGENLRTEWREVRCLALGLTRGTGRNK